MEIVSDGVNNDVVNAEITSDCLHTGYYGVKLNYKVNPAVTGYHGALWGVFLKNLSAWIDIKDRRSLELWVKGTAGGETFSIGVANEFGQDMIVRSVNYVEVSPTEWRMVNIPLADFKNTYENLKWSTKLYGVYILFDSDDSPVSICIDDIRFVP